MKFKHKKYFLLLPLVALTSCGYSLDYIVEGNKYNSPVFAENYYRHWDQELVNAKEGLNVDVENNITAFSDLFKIDASVYDKYKTSDDYGEDYKMNLVDDMFNYGYQSKLFDGQVQCLGYYQLARVQIDEGGFSMRFSKEGNNLDYFAMQFKATTDNTAKCYMVNSEEFATKDADMFHDSTVNLAISLYTKNDDNNIVKNDFKTSIDFNNHTTNYGSHYKFLAFSLKDYNLSRLVGISFTYSVDDELINWNKQKGIDVDYSLMLYELFLPYTSWH